MRIHQGQGRGASLGSARGRDPTVHAQNASRDLMSPPGRLVPPGLVCLPSGKKGRTTFQSSDTPRVAHQNRQPLGGEFASFSDRRTDGFV